jgi:RES domain-containing protein
MVPECVTSAYEPNLPNDWNAVDRIPVSTVAIGREWLEKGEKLEMRVPSVAYPADGNLILNTAHPAMQQVKVNEKKLFEMDRRLCR